MLEEKAQTPPEPLSNLGIRISSPTGFIEITSMRLACMIITLRVLPLLNGLQFKMIFIPLHCLYFSFFPLDRAVFALCAGPWLLFLDQDKENFPHNLLEVDVHE